MESSAAMAKLGDMLHAERDHSHSQFRHWRRWDSCSVKGWLHGGGQPLALLRNFCSYFLGWLAMIWSLILL
jgi:hypothetical protein